MKIRTQLNFSIAGTAAVVFSGAIITIALVQRNIVSKQIAEEQERRVKTMAFVSSQAMFLKDEFLLLNYVRLLKKSPGVSYAYLVDKSGKILVHTESQYLYKSLSEWSAPSPDQVIERSAPVKIKKKSIGTVKIGFSSSYTRQVLSETWRRFLIPLACVGLVGFFMSLALGMGLASWMSRSIKYLAQGAKEVGRGNLSVKIPKLSSDELGNLAQHFNNMAGQLRKLDELKAEFISIVSHDLRSPLAAIISYARFLLSKEIGKLTKRQTECVSIIEGQCNRLTGLVNNILDLGKLQAGRMEFIRKPGSLKPIIEEISSLFDIHLKTREISLRIDAPDSLPQVHMDREKVTQVFTNLMSNAVKFTPRKGLVEIMARESGEQWVVVTVKNTGEGIPPDELPRMFERFHQLNIMEQRAKKIRGTGLGLAICKAIVAGHGGRIWVESNLGVETSFHFTLLRIRIPAGLTHGETK